MQPVLLAQAPPVPDPVVVIGAGGWDGFPPQVIFLIVFVTVGGAVLLFAPLVKAWARRIEGGGAAQLKGELLELQSRIDALEQHSPLADELDASYQRIDELEERVQFVERLLSRPGGGDGVGQ